MSEHENEQRNHRHRASTKVAENLIVCESNTNRRYRHNGVNCLNTAQELKMMPKFVSADIVV